MSDFIYPTITEPKSKNIPTTSQKHSTLTEAVVIGICEKYERDGFVYQRGQKEFEITVLDSKGNPKSRNIKCSTYDLWLWRQQMIKGTDIVFRDYFDDFKKKLREYKRAKRLDKVERALDDFVDLDIREKTVEKIINAKGDVVKTVEFSGINAKVASTKLKALEFVAKAEDRDHYDRPPSNINNNVLIDMNEVRKLVETAEENMRRDAIEAEVVDKE